MSRQVCVSVFSISQSVAKEILINFILDFSLIVLIDRLGLEIV